MLLKEFFDLIQRNFQIVSLFLLNYFLLKFAELFFLLHDLTIGLLQVFFVDYVCF